MKRADSDNRAEMKRLTFGLYLTIFMLYIAPAGFGQSNNHSRYEHLINADGLKSHIDTLCSERMAGRAPGSDGGEMARNYIISVLEEYGIAKRGIEYTQQFKAGKAVLHNIIGEIESDTESDEYIILGAHYDHIGQIKGIIYPGADDNASGVATLLEIARTLSRIKSSGESIPVNIIFLFFDGKEMSMAGSRYFISKLRIRSENIRFMINIDQIGSALAPPGQNSEYLLLLGEPTPYQKRVLEICNKLSGLNLELDYTFYGSEKFYEIFYKLSDHYQFYKIGVESLCFTSGITKHTYKATDTPEKIDYPLLEKRARLIFRFIYDLM